MDTQNLNQSQNVCPNTDPPTLQIINERNRQFWLEQNALRDRRILDSVIFGIAERDLRSEAARLVSAKAQKTLEQALADADNAKALFQSDFSRKGGRKRKRDALQELIVGIACEAPDISEKELYQKLQYEGGEGVVFSIDEGSLVLKGGRGMIHFEDHEGEKKVASIGGLKDRLSRAKTIIRANR